MYRISKDSVSLYAEFDYFKHPKELIKITDYNNNKFTIDTNEFSITNTSFNENKIICKIDYFSNKTVIGDEKNNKQCYLFDDNQELISSYTLKPDSTDTTVIYADNVPYFHKKEEKKVEISKITTISTAESGTLNLKGVNLIDFKKINFGNKYAQGTLNHFTVFKMFTHNEFSCNIDTSKLRKGYNYTFGLFVKNNSRTKDCKLTLKALINNEESNLTKEITYVPYDDFYLVTLTLPYFSKVNITINSLLMKFKLESSDENCEFYFSYPIFSKDDSYTLTSTTIEYGTNGIEKYSSLKLNQNIYQVDTYDVSRNVIVESSKLDFNKIPFDNILFFSTSIFDEINNLIVYKTAYEYNDLKQVTKASYYENDVLKNEVLYNYDGKGKLISKVTKDSNNVTNEIKYEYDYEENTQKLYNDNNELVLTKEFDSENKLISDKYTSLDKKYYSYNNYNSLTKINTNNYFCNFTYNKDDITNITANNRTTYKYEYNNKNQLSKVKLVDFTNSSNYLQLYSFTYNDDNIPYKIVKGNNVFTKEYVYNDDLLIQSIKENNETVTTFEYNEHDSIKKITHKVSSSKTLNKDYSYWEYDGSLWKIDYSGFIDYSIVFALYDFDNCEAAKMIKFTNTATDYTYKYEDNISNKLIEVAYYTIKHSITYDLFNNVSSVKTTNDVNNVSITYDFAYKTNSNKITSFVKDVTVKSTKNNTLLNKEDFSYSYNALGNITTMIHNNYENHYSYDSFNRLSIEDNQRMYKSFSYEYDNNGNLTMVKEGSYDFKNYKVKQRFAYNNFNQLTKVVYSDGSYDEITNYDSYGNPHLIKKTKYCLSGSCCTSENIVLSYGRNNMLERYGDNYYYYNEEGIRIAKKENGLIHKYYVEDNVIHKEEIRNKNSNQLVKEIYYYYDETGISAFRINSNIYYYLKDLTGLILGIYNSGGVIVARYVYDAFGNHKVYDGYYNANTNDSFIGNINPFRYKSYYYDKESNLYYLNSRYYSPIYYRFISIDDIDYLKSESINGINLYAYCENDPISISYNIFSFGEMVNCISSSGGTNNVYLNGILGNERFGHLISSASAVHSVVDSISSYLVGSIDGLISYYGIPRLSDFQGKLGTYSNLMLKIGIGLNIVSSAYNNYMNSNLTTGQKWASFGVDVGYIAAKSSLSYLAGALVTKGSVALGSAVACSLVGASIGGLTIGIGGAILIGGGVVVLGIIAGTILIAVVSDALDNFWEKKKEEWFN